MNKTLEQQRIIQQFKITERNIGTGLANKAELVHTHGNIASTGAIGTTANLPIITTTSGVLTTGTFGTAANTFCQGNDSRLSDARTPTAHNHAATEITSGVLSADRLATGNALQMLRRNATNTALEFVDAGAGSGDMVLASAQTNSGAKTFLDSTLLLRNVANTFSSKFTNTNTATRTYTLKDADGTIAFTSDIPTTFDISLITTADSTISANTARIANEFYEVGSGYILDIADGGILEVI